MAARLDPLSPKVSDALAGRYIVAGRLDDAIEKGKRTLELDPAYAYLAFDSGQRLPRKELSIKPPRFINRPSGFTGAPESRIGHYLCARRRRREAEQANDPFSGATRKAVPSSLPLPSSSFTRRLATRTKRSRWLERAYDDHDAVLTTTSHSIPARQSLRDDRRFIDLVRRVGLDPAKAIPPKTFYTEIDASRAIRIHVSSRSGMSCSSTSSGIRSCSSTNKASRFKR